MPELIYKTSSGIFCTAPSDDIFLQNGRIHPKFTKLLRYNTWVTNKKQEKVLLWYNWVAPTIIERRTNSCARIIPQKLTIVNVCLSMGSCQVLPGEIKRRDWVAEFDAIQLYHRRTFSCFLLVTHVLYLNMHSIKWMIASVLSATVSHACNTIHYHSCRISCLSASGICFHIFLIIAHSPNIVCCAFLLCPI